MGSKKKQYVELPEFRKIIVWYDRKHGAAIKDIAEKFNISYRTVIRYCHEMEEKYGGEVPDIEYARNFITSLVPDSLKNIAPHCHWTSGTWEHIDMKWNEIQKTGRHVRLLSDVLTHLDYEMTVQKVK